VSDHKTHFINRTIEILTQEFMITHHKSTTYYPQGNDQAKSTNKTLGRLLAKMINANQNDWDIMLFTTLWAYRTAYKVTIHATPFELVYGTQPIMSTKFIVFIQRIRNVPKDDIHLVIRVRMEEFVKLDENRWHARENMNHIQLS
jgi:hypothetical protein